MCISSKEVSSQFRRDVTDNSNVSDWIGNERNKNNETKKYGWGRFFHCRRLSVADNSCHWLFFQNNVVENSITNKNLNDHWHLSEIHYCQSSAQIWINFRTLQIDTEMTDACLRNPICKSLFYDVICHWSLLQFLRDLSTYVVYWTMICPTSTTSDSWSCITIRYIRDTQTRARYRTKRYAEGTNTSEMRHKLLRKSDLIQI